MRQKMDAEDFLAGKDQERGTTMAKRTEPSKSTSTRTERIRQSVTQMWM